MHVSVFISFYEEVLELTDDMDTTSKFRAKVSSHLADSDG